MLVVDRRSKDVNEPKPLVEGLLAPMMQRECDRCAKPGSWYVGNVSSDVL